MENLPSEPAVAARRHLHPAVILFAFALLIGFLALIAWGLNRSMRGPIQKGDIVPDIQMVTFDGKVIHTQDYAGKVIVLNFWASWCVPCEQEAAELEEAFQTLKTSDGVVFIGLAYVDTEPRSLEYLKKFNITYPNGPDLRTSISQMFRIRGVPETYVIDADGKLAFSQIGPFDSTAQIVSIVQPLIRK